eukprot:9476934-Pyramimonas_sp.AAC.1
MFGMPFIRSRAHAQAPSSSTTRAESPCNAAARSTSDTAGRTSSNNVLSLGRFARMSCTVAPPPARCRSSTATSLFALAPSAQVVTT